MEEIRTGGTKEFIFSVIWAVVLLIFGRAVIALMPQYKVIGGLITLVAFCVLGFFVLTRYSAVYTYTLKSKYLRVNRKIGHRNKEVEIALRSVVSVTAKRPAKFPKRPLNMRTTVFSAKNIWYIVYEKNGNENLLVCEISGKLADEIKLMSGSASKG